jgi:hypothetical protein
MDIISALEFGTPKIKRFTLVRVQKGRQRNLHLICLIMNPKHFLQKSCASPLHHHYNVLKYCLDTGCGAGIAQSPQWLDHGLELWNWGFTFTAGESNFLFSCVQTNNTVPSDGWQHLFTLCSRKLDMTLTTQLHLVLKLRKCEAITSTASQIFMPSLLSYLTKQMYLFTSWS